MKKYWETLNNSPWGSHVKTAFLLLLTLSLTHFWSSGFRDIIIWGTFLVLLVLGATKRFPLRFNMIIFTAALYLAWSLVSSLYSVNRAISLGEWLKLFELVAAAFVVHQLLRTQKGIERALLLVMISLTLIYLYDIVVYLRGLGDFWPWGERWNTQMQRLLHYNQPNLYSRKCSNMFSYRHSIEIDQ